MWPMLKPFLAAILALIFCCHASHSADYSRIEPIGMIEKAKGINIVCFTPDSEHIAGASAKAISLWNARTGVLEKTLLSDGEPSLLSFSPSGAWLAVAITGTRPRVALWEVATGKFKHTFDFTLPVTAMRFAPASDTLLLLLATTP